MMEKKFSEMISGLFVCVFLGVGGGGVFGQITVSFICELNGF